jgi:hypothetical protein
VVATKLQLTPQHAHAFSEGQRTQRLGLGGHSRTLGQATEALLGNCRNDRKTGARNPALAAPRTATSLPWPAQSAPEVGNVLTRVIGFEAPRAKRDFRVEPLRHAVETHRPCDPSTRSEPTAMQSEPGAAVSRDRPQNAHIACTHAIVARAELGSETMCNTAPGVNVGAGAVLAAIGLAMRALIG